jgi:Fe-S-cluster containining protein
MSSAGPWYRDGLRFACTRCGNCCGGDAGTVRVDDAEIAALARHLEMDDAEFRATYTRGLRRGDVSLRERSNGTCVFYDAQRGCTVHPERPRQCRTWPFWRAVVHSPERWAEEARGCPGMGRGPLHGAEWIERTSREDGTSGTLPR